MNPEALAKIPIVTAPVTIPEKFPDENEAVQVLEELGCVRVNKGSLHGLFTLGRYVQGAGAIPMAKGDVVVTQQYLHGAMRMLLDEMDECKKMDKADKRAMAMTTLARGLGYLASKKTEAQKLMLDLDGGKESRNSTEDSAPRVRGFTPGSEVKPSQTLINTKAVHFHNSEPPATAK
jgi:hypothetical protein